MIEQVLQVGGAQLGDAPYLGETVSYHAKSFHVFFHLFYHALVLLPFLEQLHPSHHAGDRRTQLMGRFLGESYPNLVLLGTLGGQQGDDGHYHEKHDHAQLDERINREPLEQGRLVIAHSQVVMMDGVIQPDGNAPPFLLAPLVA